MASLHPIPQVFSIRDLQRRYRSILDALKRSRGSVLLLNHNEPEAVLLDVETYNALVEDDYVYNEQRTVALVAEARASYARGKAKRLHAWDDLDR